MHKELIKILKDWKMEAHFYYPIFYKINYLTEGTKLIICTSRPGLFIGVHGSLIDKYKERIKKEIYPDLIKIEFIETEPFTV